MFRFLVAFVLFFNAAICAKLPELTPAITKQKINEILKSHATYKELTPLLVQRILSLYLEDLDPTKTYFIQSDITQWIEPTSQTLDTVLKQMNQGNYVTFNDMLDVMKKAIERHRQLEKQIDYNDLPKNLKADEFKDMKWTTNTEDLLTRLKRIRALQLESASKLNEELKTQSLQRIEKHEAKLEDEILSSDPATKEKVVLSTLLKATASALDAHTAYFTPDEAAQFMINVQQRLFGIGAQLRDDLNGFTIVKIIEGGPAANQKGLKLKDRIIAVNGVPVVGMDITDAVDLIRGEENTPVTLTVIRKGPNGSPDSEEKLDVTLKRGEVVLKESRYEVTYEPFGNGVIIYARLHSFYQDPESSSAADLSREITKIKNSHRVEGVILDLRSNAGGMLSQAVDVTGLFITKGVVVSIKDENGQLQHLRVVDSHPIWTGPLEVLINRSSASASEIVAKALQDYGRALIIGDDHSFGKGTFQTFTLNTTKNGLINPEGEYKVTRGKYYTVSGHTPQLTGVYSDIIVPGILSESEVGEKFSKFPLESDQISPNFDDNLSDIPANQREKIRQLYHFNLQQKLSTYTPYLNNLKKNSSERMQNNKTYQKFLQELKEKNKDVEEGEEEASSLNNSGDLQLNEAFNIMKDLIFLMNVGMPASIGKPRGGIIQEKPTPAKEKLTPAPAS